MPVTVLPVGVSCNLQCGYCYEDPEQAIRRASLRGTTWMPSRRT